MFQNTTLFIIALLFLPIFSNAQNRKFFNSNEESQQHQDCFLKMSKQIIKDYYPSYDLIENYIDFCYYYKINLLKHKKLLKIGVDVVDLVYASDNSDFKFATLVAPVIVECSVRKIEYDTSRKVMFHTTYTFKVDRIVNHGEWKGADEIILKMQSGPTADRPLWVDRPPVFSKEEKHFLFLDHIDGMLNIRRAFAENAPNFTESGFREIILRTLGVDTAKAENVFTLRLRFTIKNGHLFNWRYPIGRKKDIVRTIKQIAKINNLNDFMELRE